MSADPLISPSLETQKARLFWRSSLAATMPTTPQSGETHRPYFRSRRNVSPFLIVHGTHDENVPIAQPEALADKLRQAGVPVKLVEVEDAHTYQTPEARKRLALETQAFFTQYLRPGNLK